VAKEERKEREKRKKIKASSQNNKPVNIKGIVS
jgi:hypothetical protein